jgi:L-ectoine synthase
MGFTLCHTVVRAGTESLLHYRNHLEACYCIAGEGEVEDMQGNVFPIRPGDIYVLDQHDRHYLRGGKEQDLILVSVSNPPLRGGKEQDLILVSVSNPPLRGDERHNLNDSQGSAY